MSARHLQANQSDFVNAFETAQTQLVWKWLPADLVTPCAAYMKLCGLDPYCFLLESVEGGNTLGRYSILGMDPDLIWTCKDKTAQIEPRHGSEIPDTQGENALNSLKALIAHCKIDFCPDHLPPMASSGLFGYLSYDMIRLIEDIPNDNADPLELPDSIMMRPTILLIFDNVQNMMCLATPCYQHSDNCTDAAPSVFESAMDRLRQVQNSLETATLPPAMLTQSALNLPLDVRSNTTEDDYKFMVSKAVEYIQAGEIFQCVPAQRFDVDFDLPSFALYRSLRRLNPSPFMFHVAFEDFSIVGSSPEIMVRVRDDMVTIRPLAGTRKRGADDAEDQALAKELLADPKERAEHLMLLDLGRNDVGRVVETGTVNVTEQFKVELYSHVMHIVSNVEGQLRRDLDGVDAFFAGFPAGTVSGAPKVRAMEIIDELEKAKRTFYAGSIGYFSGNGAVDTCIALRTALVKDNKVYIQSGAGVVADSIPQSEYDETVSKAKALVHAAEMAVQLSQE